MELYKIKTGYKTNRLKAKGREKIRKCLYHDNDFMIPEKNTTW